MKKHPFRKWIFHSFLGAVLLGVLLLQPIRAQEIGEGEIRMSDLVERIEVRLLLVDVVVTDQAGNLVTDLRKEDFELLLHNRRVLIDTFDRRDLTPIRVSSQRTAPGEAKFIRPVQKQKNWTVLFFDTFNSGMQGQLEARKQVLEYLERDLLPADEMMVISHSNKLRVVQNFTSNREDWIRSVRELAEDESDLDPYLKGEVMRQSKVADTCHMSCDGAWSLANFYAMEEQNRALQTLQALRGLVLALSGLHGKKSVIYISEGMRQIPGVEYFGICPGCTGITEGLEIQMFDVRQEMEDLFRDSNDSNVTFHTIDIRENLQLGSAAIGFSDFLSNLAYQTGGVRGPASAPPVRNLERVGDQMGIYYIIGHTLPGTDPDNHLYQIKVKVKRPGLQVRFRKSFRDFGWREREERTVLGAVALPDVFRDVPVEARVNPVRIGKKRFETFLEVGLPVSSIFWIPTPLGEFGQVEFVGAVTDQWGRVEHHFRDTLEMKRVSEGTTEARQGVFYRGAVDLKPGRYEMVCAVHDMGAGKVGAVRVPFVVPEISDQGLSMSGPNLARLARGDMVVGAYSLYPRKKKKKFPKEYREENVVPLFGDELGREDVLVTSLDIYDPQGRKNGPDLDVRISFIQAGEVVARETPVMVVNESDKESRALRFALMTPLDGFPAGDYDLLVEVTDPYSERDLAKVVPFRIRSR